MPACARKTSFETVPKTMPMHAHCIVRVAHRIHAYQVELLAHTCVKVPTTKLLYVEKRKRASARNPTKVGEVRTGGLDPTAKKKIQGQSRGGGDGYGPL